MADDDDLYADLYASEDVVKTADDGAKDAKTDSKDVKASAATSSKSSFIPPAPSGSSTAPYQSSSTSSFIPPPSVSSSAAAASKGPASVSRPFPETQAAPSSVSSQQASATATAPRAQIETAPMTNSDYNRGATSDHSGLSNRPVLPHEMPDEGKLFVGGLNWDTTDEGLKNYFSQFGKVNHCLIMRDLTTGRSRGFAFLTFDDPKAVNSVMVKEHFLDGKLIDPKRAIPRQENARTAKCFVGGIPQSATQESFRAFFEQHGQVLDSTLMIDRETGKPRGYGFITFADDSVVEDLMQIDYLAMDGKQIEVKRATPRNADGSRRQGPGAPVRRGGYNNYNNDDNYSGGNYGSGGGGGNSSGMMGMGGMMGDVSNNPFAAMMMNPMFAGMMGNQQQQQGGSGGGFDPAAMAQMFQQFQQNMSGGGGGAMGAFNPLMFQQMMATAMAGGAGQNAWSGGNFAGAGGNRFTSQGRGGGDESGDRSDSYDRKTTTGGASYRNDNAGSEDGGRDSHRRERSPERGSRGAGGGGDGGGHRSDRW